MSDAPIEPKDYLSGVKVVQIEDLRVARGLTRRPLSSCRHQHMVYDNRERRVWCSDCESEVEPFDAFMGLVERMDDHIKRLKRREQAVKDAEAHVLRSRASKVMDEAWRKTSMAPLCPHCMAAILPEDVVTGLASTSKSLVIAARKRASNKGYET